MEHMVKYQYMKTEHAEVYITDIDLSEHVQQFIALNKDVSCTPEVKQKIKSIPEGTLLKIRKKIGSLEILDVEEVTEELLEKEL